MPTLDESPHLTAREFRHIQDDVLGWDNLKMAEALGLARDTRNNAIRKVERFRNGQVDPIPGTIATLMWYFQNATAHPAWVEN